MYQLIIGLDEHAGMFYNYHRFVCGESRKIYAKLQKGVFFSMQEMDIKLIFGVLLGRIKWIVASVAVGVLLFASYAYFFVPEQYTSYSLLYVRNMASDTQTNSATVSNLSAAEYLANTYAVVMKTQPVLNKAYTRLNGELSIDELKSMVSSSLVEDTTLLEISARHSDPKMAQQACSAMAYAIADTFPTMTGEATSANVVEDATEAVQTAPNVLRSALIGALIGLALSVAVILLHEFLDNTIRDKETLQMQINVPVLGEIPSFTPNNGRKGGKHHA